MKSDYPCRFISLEDTESGQICPGSTPLNARPASGRQAASGAGGQTIFTCGTCTSTLDVAWNLARQGGLRPWDSVLAEDQTAGRGQLRRHWISGKGNVYATLCLPDRFRGDFAAVQVGWLVLKALQEVLRPYLHGCVTALKLKWPNDLLWEGNKIGGILLEEKGTDLMAGIGINLLHSPGKEQLRADFSLPAGNMAALTAQCGFIQNFSAQRLWLVLVSMMRFWYEAEVLSAGKEITAAIVEPELAFLGEMVLVLDNAATQASASAALHQPERVLVGDGLFGRLLGLGPNAELRLGTEKGEILVASGSVYPVNCADYQSVGPLRE